MRNKKGEIETTYETIYTCLRNEIGHKRTNRILNEYSKLPIELTLERTTRDIKEYVGSLSRIVRLAIQGLT
ncbi:MAG: hypothetical protein Fur0042_29680 [Cyanophyceae cyanobacterium]